MYFPYQKKKQKKTIPDQFSFRAVLLHWIQFLNQHIAKSYPNIQSSFPTIPL